MALVGALAPEIEYDALWYHLWLPQQWLLAGRPVDIVEEYVSLYPLGWDLLYGAALTVGGAGAAKLLHFACLPLLAATTWRLARELAPDASPALAAALTVAAPTLIWEATTAYVDLALAWYLALAVLAVVRYHATHDRRWLIIGAVVLGGALAIKHLGLVAMAIIGTSARRRPSSPDLDASPRCSARDSCLRSSRWRCRRHGTRARSHTRAIRCSRISMASSAPRPRSGGVTSPNRASPDSRPGSGESERRPIF
jgi:hypothetical protein